MCARGENERERDHHQFFHVASPLQNPADSIANAVPAVIRGRYPEITQIDADEKTRKFLSASSA
jgi:hypothetical protein